jgi:hypothetical protein
MRSPFRQLRNIRASEDALFEVERLEPFSQRLEIHTEAALDQKNGGYSRENNGRSLEYSCNYNK